MKYKMLFISSFNSEIVSVNGVAKKLLLEIKAFIDFGYTVDYIEINNREVFLVTDTGKKQLCRWEGSYHKTFVAIYKALSAWDPDYNLIYFRYEHISVSMLHYFRKFKSKGKKLIIGELPTYMSRPYSTVSLKSKMIFYAKRLMEWFVPKTIDYMVTFSEHKSIFCIQTIRIENFFDVRSSKLRTPVDEDKITVNLLALAQLTPAHGVDLILKGINEYVNNGEGDKKVHLHVVGDGFILDALKKMAAELHIERYVTFHGSLGGEQLDRVFDLCDIGFGALAIFRKGSFKLSELKIREFTARGLPFVYNAYEPQLNGQFFSYKMDFEEKPVDIRSVIEFHERMKKEQNVRTRMRAFAEREFTAEKQLGIVNTKIRNILEE